MLDGIRMDMYTVRGASMGYHDSGYSLDLLLMAPLRMNKYVNISIPVSSDGWESNRVLHDIPAFHEDLMNESTCFNDQPVIIDMDEGHVNAISNIVRPDLKTMTSDGSVNGDDKIDDTIFRLKESHVWIDDGTASIIITMSGQHGDITISRPIEDAGVLLTTIVDASSDMMRRLSGMVTANGKPFTLTSIVKDRPFRVMLNGDSTPRTMQSIYNDEEFSLDRLDDPGYSLRGRAWEVSPPDPRDLPDVGTERTVESIEVGLCRFTAEAFIKIRFSDHDGRLASHAWTPLDGNVITALTGDSHVIGDLSECVKGDKIRVSRTRSGGITIMKP